MQKKNHQNILSFLFHDTDYYSKWNNFFLIIQKDKTISPTNRQCQSLTHF